MTFDDALEILKKRVDQVCGYQKVLKSKTGMEELAHFTHWESCCNMLKALDSNSNGIAFWAGEADCLNDPLEGYALLKFAEETAGGNKIKKVRNYPPEFSKHGEILDHYAIGSPYLNPKEWRLIFKNLQNLYGGIHHYIVPSLPASDSILSSNTYIVSFCVDADRLDLWRAYGDKAEGACLVMPLKSAVKMVEGSDWTFFRVAYDARSKARAWAVLHGPLNEVLKTCEDKNLSAREKLKRYQNIRETLDPVHYLFKHEQFRTEHEVRLVRTAASIPKLEVKPNDKGAYTLTNNFFLGSARCRVILGPKSPDTKIRAATLRAYFSSKFPNHQPTVHRSNVPFQ
jgi:Protein of unknown function (DUF2971)